MNRSGRLRESPAASNPTTRATRSGRVLSATRNPTSTKAKPTKTTKAKRGTIAASNSLINEPRTDSNSTNGTATNVSIVQTQGLTESSAANSQPRTSTGNSQDNAIPSRPVRNVQSTKRPRNDGPGDTSDDDNDLSEAFNPGDQSDSDHSSLQLEEDSPRPSTRRLQTSERQRHGAAASKRPRTQTGPQNQQESRVQSHLGTHSQHIGSTINHATQIDSFTDSSRPTVKNYQELTSEWPIDRISAVKRTSSSVPNNIEDEARALKKLYLHHKEMLAMMGNVSLFTLDKAIGDLGSSRGQGQDGYRLWMSYSKLVNVEYMPRSDQPESLAERNRRLGKAWTSLSDMEKLVFHPSVFYTLSGLPPPKKQHKQLDITPEEIADLQDLYDETVCAAKVCKVYANVSSGIPGGQSLADHNRLSKKRVEQIHTQIDNESTRMNFAYYFIASGTHPQTEEGKGSHGWCIEYTSHPEMAEYVRVKSNFPTIFAARVQGKAVEEAVANAVAKSKLTVEKEKRQQPADAIKTELAKQLRAKLKEALGRSPAKGFTRKPNPGQCLIDKGYPVKIVQLEGSSLKPEDLALGVDKMTSAKRSLWLDDVNAGLFKIVKDWEVSEGINDNLGNTNGSNDGNGLNQGDFEEEGEWGGISGLDEVVEDENLGSDHRRELQGDNSDLPEDL